MYRSLEKKFIVIHCMHFVTSWVNSDFRNTVIKNHVCEWSVSWKVLENSVLMSV